MTDLKAGAATKRDFSLEAISNGLGSQSMYLLLLASRGEIPATASITADTGAENDCLWNTGERTTAREYWERVAGEFCCDHNITPCFVRSVDKYKRELPDLMDHLQSVIAEGKMKSAKIPLFGSEGGRLMQSCTDKWKIRAIRQQARRMGATKLITAQGIHAGEIGRRARGRIIGKHGEFTLYQDTLVRKKESVDVKWCQHYYPLADRGLGRNKAIEALEMEGIPYLVSSQCDFCPHNDLARWDRHSHATLLQIAAVEDSMGGQFFFTDERVPLLDALEIKRNKPKPKLDASFGCGNAECGI